MKHTTLSRRFDAMVILAIFVTALALQFLFSTILPRENKVNESADYLIFYSVIADRLNRGDGYTNSWYFSSHDGNAKPAYKNEGARELITHWPPGYPVILGKLFYIADQLNHDRNKVVLAFIFAIYALTSVVVYKISTQFASVGTSVVSALIWMSYPFNLWLTKQPNTEIPYIFLFYTAILLLFKYISSRRIIYLVFSALILAASTYVRAISFFLPLVFMAILVLNLHPVNKQTELRYRIKSATIFFGIYLACLLPWEYFVYSETGKIIPMATSGDSLTVDSINNILTAKLGGEISLPSDVKVMLTSSLEHTQSLGVEGRQIRPAELIINNLLDSPVASIKYLFIKITRSLYGTDMKRHEQYIVAIQIVYLVIMLAGVYLAKNCRNDVCVPHAILFAFVSYYWLVCIIGLPLLRYMIPALGLLTIYPSVLVIHLFGICLRRFNSQVQPVN